MTITWQVTWSTTHSVAMTVIHTLQYLPADPLNVPLCHPSTRYQQQQVWYNDGIRHKFMTWKWNKQVMLHQRVDIWVCRLTSLGDHCMYILSWKRKNCFSYEVCVGTAPHPLLWVSSSLRRVWSQYSNTRWSLLRRRNTSSRFTRLPWRSFCTWTR